MTKSAKGGESYRPHTGTHFPNRNAVPAMRDLNPGRTGHWKRSCQKKIYITYLKHRRYSATIFVPHILCGCFFLKAVLGRIKQKTLCQNCAKTRVGARLEDLAAGVICSQNKLEHIFFRAIWYPGLICQGSRRLIFRVFTFS